MEEWSDPVAKGYFLLSSSIQVPLILIAYLTFSIWIGPAIMRNRKPLGLTRVLQIYVGRVNVFCDFPKSRTDLEHLKCVRLHWFYFLFKLLDCMDTIFFVLRKKNNHVTFLHLYHHSSMLIVSWLFKKNNHVTFLHLYHHSSMLIVSWLFAKFIPGPLTGPLGVINSLVHAFMYFYYFLASFGTKYEKYLTKWKINLTRLQIAQFMLVTVQGVIVLLLDCSNKTIPILEVVQGCVFTYLFVKFYIRTYMVKKPALQKKNE
ncbi:GNS1/SUR4 family [Popillia japonica]|uniref:Elongation of very long chain fatty acids protein n=1 Tax=Popillia japonica TaxID=7064 RepID=A0AAW1LWG9_POPJA